jgi:hypothetical protein
MFSHVNVGAMTSYTDFDFDSTTGDNFNRFQGYSKLYSIGAGNIALYKGWAVGVNLFTVDTQTRAQVYMAPGVPSISEQSTRNNSIFGHVIKQIKPNFFFDVAGAYGQNKVNTQSTIIPAPGVTQIGYASNHSTNWFAALTAIYSRPWNNFLLTANARLLYSQILSPEYQFTYVGSLPNQSVQPLTNQTLFSTENIEIGYKFDTKKSPLTPFLNAGLLQVLDYRNSREIVAATINGISPQLNMNKNGYRLGGGFGFQHKKFAIRLEEQYYTSAGTYRSYQTILGVKYAA